MSSTGQLFTAVALFITVVNIITSLIHLQTNDDDTKTSFLDTRVAATATFNHSINNRMLSVEQFMDCNREDSLCTYLDPVHFYDTLPHHFRKAAHQEVYGHPNRTLHVNWARFVFAGRENNTLDYTYIHVRKAGGNTVYDVARRLQNTANIQVQVMPSVPVHQLVQRIGLDAFIEKMQHMAIQTKFFTFVRNPISRFCSAMGQIYDKKRHTLQAVDCVFPNEPRREMTCVLQLLSEGKTINNHLIPALIELYQMVSFGAGEKVAVFSLEALDDFMRAWNIPPFRQNEAIEKRYSPEMLTSDMISDICRVYQVDVLMIQSLGMTVPECGRYQESTRDMTQP